MELSIARRVILGVLLLGMVGLLAELFLLGHYEDRTQWVPLVALAAGLGAVALDGVYGRWWTRGVLCLVMIGFITTGVLGVYFTSMAAASSNRRWIPR